MKTTLDLPDDLVHEVKLLAVNERMKLKDAVADLLRKGLAASLGRSRTRVKVDKASLLRRRELTQKFVSGEWGLDLAGFDEGRDAERAKSRERAKAWRD